MEEQDEDFTLPVKAFKFSLLGTFIDVLDAVLDNLKAHNNYRVYRRGFQEQAALEIETITQEG